MVSHTRAHTHMQTTHENLPKYEKKKRKKKGRPDATHHVDTAKRSSRQRQIERVTAESKQEEKNRRRKPVYAGLVCPPAGVTVRVCLLGLGFFSGLGFSVIENAGARISRTLIRD